MSFLEYPKAVDFYCKLDNSAPGRAYVNENGIILLTEGLEVVFTLPWSKIKCIKAKKTVCGITIKQFDGTKTRLELVRYTELGRFFLAVQGYVDVAKGFGWKFGRRVVYIEHATRDQQPEQKTKPIRSGDKATEIQLVHGSFERMDDPRYPTHFFNKRDVPPPPPPSPASPLRKSGKEESPNSTPGQRRRSDRLARSALRLNEEDIREAMELRPATPPKAATPTPEKAPRPWKAPEALLVPPFEAGELLWNFNQAKPSLLFPPYPCKHAWYDNCECHLKSPK